MPMQNNLRVIFYEPSGRGGISQYTYQLAESLACNGSDVIVETTEDYELKHLRRSFKIYTPFTKSWVKSFLNRMFSQFQKKGASHIDNPNVSNTNYALNHQKKTVNLLLELIRAWFIRIKIIFFVYKPLKMNNMRIM